MDGFAFRMRRSLLIALAIGPSLSGSLMAQVTTGPDGRTVVPRDTSHAAEHKTLFTYRDAALAAGFVGLTFAMFPADRHIAESLQDEDVQANKFFANSG